MPERIHRFYCPRCDRFMYGETVEELVKGVNFHATSLHPSDFSNWTPGTIIASTHYSPPENYTIPQISDSLDFRHQQTKQTIDAPPKEPVLTQADRRLLFEHGIRWD